MQGTSAGKGRNPISARGTDPSAGSGAVQGMKITIQLAIQVTKELYATDVGQTT